MGCRNSKPHHHEVRITIDGDGDARVEYGDYWLYAMRQTRPWWRPWSQPDSLEEFAQRIEATAREVIANHDRKAKEGMPSDVAADIAARLNRELAKAEREPTWPDEWQGES